jgi:hypothetical protein
MKKQFATAPTWVQKTAQYAVAVVSCAALYGCANVDSAISPSSQTDTNARVTAAAVAGAPSSLDIYWQNYTAGAAYTNSNATSDFKSITFWDSSPGQTIRQYDNMNGYKAIRQKFAANTYGTGGGTIAETNLADANEYTMEYKVFFESGFQFSRGNSGTVYGGGKLPGLAGGSRPGGGQKKTDGMSARIMWRKDPTRSTPNGGYIELYHYWRNQAGTYGDQLYLQDVVAGRWYTIKIRVNLGTSTSDGRLKVWVDGVSKIDRAFRYLASGASWKLNGTMFHMFYGGNDSSWAPTADTYLMLDNFRVNSVAF